jgi:hypothetical protein
MPTRRRRLTCIWVVNACMQRAMPTHASFTFRWEVSVGEFRKTRHPRNVRYYEIREMSFQES